MKTMRYICLISLIIIFYEASFASLDEPVDRRTLDFGEHPGYLVNGILIKTHNGYIPLNPAWEQEECPIVIQKQCPGKTK